MAVESIGRSDRFPLVGKAAPWSEMAAGGSNRPRRNPVLENDSSPRSVGRFRAALPRRMAVILRRAQERGTKRVLSLPAPAPAGAGLRFRASGRSGRRTPCGRLRALSIGAARGAVVPDPKPPAEFLKSQSPATTRREESGAFVLLSSVREWAAVWPGRGRETLSPVRAEASSADTPDVVHRRWRCADRRGWSSRNVRAEPPTGGVAKGSSGGRRSREKVADVVFYAARKRITARLATGRVDRSAFAEDPHHLRSSARRSLGGESWESSRSPPYPRVRREGGTAAVSSWTRALGSPSTHKS